NLKLGIGIDNIPDEIKHSEVLTGNDLGQLGNLESIPNYEEVQAFSQMPEIVRLMESLEENRDHRKLALHLAAKELIKASKVSDAWKLLLLF
ncbi:MAG: flavin reductase family protein, partial [Bacteroidota bacterium]